MAKDVRIIPASGEINFNENSTEQASVYQLGNDIHVTSVGDVVLGDGTPANLQLGGVGTSVELSFLGGGTITSEGGSLNIGASGDVINLNATGVTYNLPSNINAQSLQGYVPSSFALASHAHTISNVTGLQTALDGKQPVGTYLTGIADNSIGALQLNVSGNGTTAQYLRSDGDGSFTWATPTDTNTTYNQATSSVLGLIKLGSDTAQTVAPNTVTATASRTYAVQVNASGQAVVNVPWVDTDTNTTYSVFTSTVNGLAPLSGGGTTKYLRADGTWVVPPDTNTTYSVFTSSANGLAPLSGGGTTKYLRADGTWVVPPDTNTTYSQATSSALGLIKLGSDTAQTVAANAITTTASRTYAVQVNASGQAVVNVPWSDTDTNTTYSQATSAVLGLIKLEDDTVQTVAANAITTTASRTYGIQVNSTGQAVVNVPWSDTNTTYSQATATTLGLIKLGDAAAQTVAPNAVTTTASRTYAVQVNASGQAVVNVPWVDTNTVYTLPVAGTAIGGVKSGTDITVDASGNVSVNDDSHNHTIANVDGLQTALDGKASTSHTHSYLPLTGGTLTGGLTTPSVNITTNNGVATLANDDTLSGWAYNGKKLVVSAQETAPTGVFVSADGLNLYVCGSSGDDINRYVMSTAWDISTATYHSVSSNVGDTAPQDIYISPDGRNIYIVGSSGDTVRQFSNTAAWVITGLTFVRSFSVASQDSTPTGLDFKDDGTIMYISGDTNNKIYQYNLGTAWNISTAVYDQELSVSAYASTPNSVEVSADGTKLYTVGSSGDEVNRFDLLDPYNISTAVFFNNLYVGFNLSSPTGLYVNLAQDRIYIVGSSSDSVFQYNAASNSVFLDTQNLFINGGSYTNGNVISTGSTRIDGTLSVASTTYLGTVSAGTTTVNTFTAGSTTSSVNLGTGHTTGAVTIGGTAGTGNITIGRSTSTQAINIGGSGNTITFGTTPIAPTPATATNDTTVATTAFVKAQGYLTSVAANSIGAGELNVSGNGTTAQYLRSDGDGSFTWATPTDTNTTYSAGTALSLTGTTFSVADNAIGATQLNVSGNGTTAQYLRSDGDGSFTWATPTDTNTTYNQATASVLGLIKLSSDTAQTVAANTITATASRTYALQVNASGQGVVNVPWSDTNTTYTASTGLTLTGTAFSVTANGIGATQLNVTGNGTTAQYLRSDGDGSFTWATPPDTNTTYSAGQGLSLSGTTFSTNGGWTGVIDIPGTGQITVSAGIITDFTPA